MNFKLQSNFTPKGDQPKAIKELLKGLKNGEKFQVLLGVTGSGKTYTIAKVIEGFGKPTLVISHNKTLAAQLYQEFKSFFPENRVEYFVSYYDYYQPEAYIPQTDTYIEKETSVNDEIDRLRIRATEALFERRDVIIVASVSCIYGIGAPEDFFSMLLKIEEGERWNLKELLSALVQMQYERTQYDLYRGSFRLRGDTLDIFPAQEEFAIRLNLQEDTISSIYAIDPLKGQRIKKIEKFSLFPKSHFATPQERIKMAISSIREELGQRLKELKEKGKLLEAERLELRTNYDLEMLEEMGWCQGIENYSRHLTGRAPGQPPYTLVDYFPKDYLLIIDESHQTIPQLKAMEHGDRSRKETLVEFGFRLPSALDNRPLSFSEFLERINQVIFVSATPGPFELELTGGKVVEQIIRPTGLLDPEVEIRSAENQIENLQEEIEKVLLRKERVLVTTLTKRMAEELSSHFTETGLKCRYLHSDVDTLERIRLINQFRKGDFDILVGINLLREGLDLPEVSLVAILDASEEGFLRSYTSLIQTAGRAARNVNGKVILYVREMTKSIEEMVKETKRRRKIQEEYNKKNNIIPETIIKDISSELVQMSNLDYLDYSKMPEIKPVKDVLTLRENIKKLEREMKKAAKRWDFEKAIEIREKLMELKKLEVFV
ncbi:MAG: excinuclease ABC subunit UvrB [Thermoanaerobaculia bacterium]